MSEQPTLPFPPGMLNNKPHHPIWDSQVYKDFARGVMETPTPKPKIANPSDADMRRLAQEIDAHVNGALAAKRDHYSALDRHPMTDAPCKLDAMNPKDLIGRTKPGIGRIPPVALLEEGVIMDDGGDKYGPFNWQDAPIQASIYYDAAMRHLLAWYTGQNVDPGSKSGGLNLAAVRACCGILIDAQATGSIIDDRPRRTASAADAIERIGAERLKRAKAEMDASRN